MAANVDFELDLWKTHKLLLGADEVGRGALAGPVYAAVVVLDPKLSYLDLPVLINDSKKLTPSQREKADSWIRKHAISFAVAKTSACVIDRIGIVKATQKAYRRAILSSQRIKNIKVEFALFDAFFVPFVKGLPRQLQMAIIKGDQLSLSIAAASIIAKVQRDSYMSNLDINPKYSRFNFKTHKGYGTKAHIKAIGEFGPTKYHRLSFIKQHFASSQAQ